MVNQDVLHQPQGFHIGEHTILSLDKDPEMGMNFKLIKLRAGESYAISKGYESALLLMTGKVIFSDGKLIQACERYCYFRELPLVFHVDSSKSIEVQAGTHCEVLLVQTENPKTFESIFFDATNILESEQRGQGLLHNTSLRNVRTVFDKRNRQQSNLVLGEIITYSGHWSSSPSHTHIQPEVYHYRFSEPQGFAFAENGKQALKIAHNDTLFIRKNKAHAHAVMPGYALYTLWFIRHLEKAPYYQPDFQQEHAWTMKKSANLRVWQALEDE